MLGGFRLEGDELKFDDLAETHGLRGPEAQTVEWFQFRNIPSDMNAIANYNLFALPERVADADTGSYFVAHGLTPRLSMESPPSTVT